MNKKLSFQKSGTQLFLLTLKVIFLSIVTLGNYIPWGIIAIQKFFINNTKLDDKPFEYEGDGLSLVFKIILKNIFLIFITLGFYLPITIYNVSKYFIDNTFYDDQKFTLTKRNMRKYYLLHLITGLFLISTIAIFCFDLIDGSVDFTNMILPLSLYIVSSLAVTAAILKLVIGNIKYGDTYFVLESDLSSLIMKNALSSMITFGIYSSWANANIYNAIFNNLKFDKKPATFSDIEGFDLFKIDLKGRLLCLITLGIYSPWYLVSQLNYLIERIEVTPVIE